MNNNDSLVNILIDAQKSLREEYKNNEKYINRLDKELERFQGMKSGEQFNWLVLMDLM